MAKGDDSSLGKKIRSAEKKLTKELLKWKLERTGVPTPDEETMDRNSDRIVDEAHKIMKKQARSIFDELKQTKEEFLKAYRDEDEKEKE